MLLQNKDFSFSKQTLKLLCSGSFATYSSIALLILVLGVLQVLNSVPLLSPTLEAFGIIWLYQNRRLVVEKVTEFIAPSTTQIKSLIANEKNESSLDAVPLTLTEEATAELKQQPTLKAPVKLEPTKVK